MAVYVYDDNRIFLSTPSARRATHLRRDNIGDTTDFYPRPPRGGRQTRYKSEINQWRFLSTPSARRATRRTSSAKLSE